MLHPSHHRAPHERPVDLGIQLLVHQAAHRHVLAADQVQAVADLGAGLVVVVRPDDALDRLTQHQVRGLVAREQRAEQGAPVGGED